MSCCQSHSSARALSTMKLDTPKRNHYYFSKLMDVLQFDMEQSYLNDKRWLLNRLSLGTGVVCGLNVKVLQGKLCVAPGVAIDTYGHEIIVPSTFCLDPWLLPDACGRPTRELPRNEAHRLTLCLAYRECLADQTPVLVTDCRSEQLCEAGTVVESFDLFMREDWPPPKPDFCTLLSGQGAPNNGYEVVATVPVGGAPVGVAVAADRMHALIANEQQLPVLQVLDLATNAIVHTFEDAVTAPIGGITIAPEGGLIFVTHARGVVAVNLQSSPPKLASLLTDTQYGRCAASHGGTRLHAINVSKNTVELIDVATSTVKPLTSTTRPSDVAVSSDSGMLVVADTTNNAVTAIDTITGQIVWTKQTSADTVSLAATGAAAGREAWSAARDVARRFNASGVAADVAYKANVLDGAFTSEGDRYYVTSDATDLNPEQVVVMTRAGTQELARLPVGRSPRSIAIVPQRLRALIANAGSGTVTIIDVPGLRERLCRATLGACPDPDDSPCVPLATIDLLESGEIGRVNVCAPRTRLLSNEALLELILCLADRLDDCCTRHEPVPPPTDDPPPPEEETLRVTGVQFLGMEGQVRLTMQAPGALATFNQSSNVNRVRLTFNRPINPATVRTSGLSDDPRMSSLHVAASWSQRPLSAIAGGVQVDTPTSVIYVIAPDPRQFVRGLYRLTLFGTTDPANLRPAVAATDGDLLDGEPSAFPSGNDTAGGNFVINFRVD
jgi:DNA-binding beta-propeller fold protein YncE